MRLLSCIIIFLINYNFIAQDNFVTVAGRVLSSSNNENVENAIITLKLKGGYSFEQKTDTSGKYEFKFQIDEPSTCTVSIITNKITKSKSFRYGFLANKDIGKIELKTGVIYIKDFDLTPVSCGGLDFSAILFNTNSIISCNDSLSKIDSTRYGHLKDAIIFLYQTLKENPTVIIELLGHASTIEKNHEQLALYRAQVIKEILIAKGINRNRLMTKSWGNHKLLIKDNVIKKAKTNEEKAALHLKNQRVVFRIINWDFKE
jgi:hypothetical protein